MFSHPVPIKETSASPQNSIDITLQHYSNAAATLTYKLTLKALALLEIWVSTLSNIKSQRVVLHYYI